MKNKMPVKTVNPTVSLFLVEAGRADRGKWSFALL